MPARILVVDDDASLADVVRRYLEREGFSVQVVGDGRQAVSVALEELPDLLVLDLMLPDLGGFEVYRQVRAVAPIPVVMLTARGEEEDRVTGLELGADDYVSKPFSPRELTLRVKAVLRRAGGGVSPSGELEIDLAGHEARRHGELLNLTAKEFDLLSFLMRHPGEAFYRHELFKEVWGWTWGDTATVTVHVRRLRCKSEADPAAPKHLITVRGVGYRFDP